MARARKGSWCLISNYPPRRGIQKSSKRPALLLAQVQAASISTALTDTEGDSRCSPQKPQRWRAAVKASAGGRLMSRGRVTFKQCDVERLLRAYQKLGFEPSQVSLRVDRHGTI